MEEGVSFWKGKRVVITGGAGFIGSNLSKDLVREGALITIIDNFERGRREYISATRPPWRLIEGDLKDLSFCKAAISPKTDIVIHMASKVGGIGLYTSSPYTVMSENILIDANVLRAVLFNNIKRYFYASSAHIYPKELQGTPNSPAITEDQGYPAACELSYGWAKLISEKEIEYALVENPNLHVAIARYIGIYGENQDFDFQTGSCIPVFTTRAIKYPEVPFTVWGTGKETRSYCFIDDAIQCTKIMIEKMEEWQQVGPYNVGKQERISIGQLAELVIEITGKDIPIEFDLTKETFIWGQWCNCQKAKEEINFEAKTTLQDGLRRVYNDIRERI
tara:strand:- start:6146 stop:7150 length:1005 start_codon:yes stop_codon:yes gene_type:complete